MLLDWDYCHYYYNFNYILMASKRGTLKKEKHLYQDKVIDYPNAPNGRAYIGLAKAPLMPNENGIGFQGVLLQDENRELVECSNCGNWQKIITAAHLEKCAKGIIKDTKEYKEKFGLYEGKGLVSDETSLRLTKACLKNKEKNGFEKFASMANKVRFIPEKGFYTKKRAHQNRFGNCPEQLKFRLKEFILRNRELPAGGNQGENLYKILWRKFGSLGKAMKHYGLPYFERIGTTYIYQFPKGDVMKFNINKFDQRELLFEKIITECEIFTEADRTFYLRSI